MKAQLAFLLAGLALVAGCGERIPEGDNQGSTTPPYVRAEADSAGLREMVTPVRIGEQGPNFAACNARGAVRDRVGGGPVPVRAAPYELAGEIAALPPAAEFFICARTHDQRWFGIVYDEGGQAAERCGVSSPVPQRRIYQGPCAAGWVPSARIRLISGVPHQLPPEKAVETPPPAE